jgi:hypothetical protein
MIDSPVFGGLSQFSSIPEDRKKGKRVLDAEAGRPDIRPSAERYGKDVERFKPCGPRPYPQVPGRIDANFEKTSKVAKHMLLV